MKNNNLAPIILFVYNRYDTLVKVIRSLKLNNLSKKSELYIFSDGPKNDVDNIQILNIRLFLKKICGFKKIIIYESQRNLGLSDNIITGVTKILNKYNKAIIIEDDIEVSKYFLEYMNKALNLYKNDKKVASIHAYQYPIYFTKSFPETFFLKGADCWGWGTWKRAWSFFDKNGTRLYGKIIKNKILSKEFNYGNSYNFLKMLKNQSKGKINSWAIRWYASTFVNNMYTLYPKKSYVKNIGFDNNGTHPNNFFHYNQTLKKKSENFEKVPIQDNIFFRKKLECFYKKRKYLRYVDFSKFWLFFFFQKII
jgi:hypothetical protein